MDTIVHYAGWGALGLAALIFLPIVVGYLIGCTAWLAMVARDRMRITRVAKRADYRTLRRLLKTLVVRCGYREWDTVEYISKDLFQKLNENDKDKTAALWSRCYDGD